MKRLIALFCALVLFIYISPSPTSAAGEVFVATNNMILPLTDAMPMKSGGAWYVDYNCFTSGDLKVSSSYNSDSRTLVLYTWDTTLVFNLDDHTAYNTKDNVMHSQTVLSSHGTFYVPAQFTASQLGIIYSYIDTASCIRFRSTSKLTDEMFAYIVKSKIPELIAQYNASKTPSTNTVPSTSSPSGANNSGTQTENDEVTVQKRVFLTFDILSGENNNAILDVLYRYRMPATFFITGNTLLSNDDSIRRMTIQGHEIGILGFSGTAEAFSSPETMLNELKQANNLLYGIAHTKTRLVRIPGGSKATLSAQCADSLTGSGYRYWDWTIDANNSRTSASANRIANTVINTLKNRTHAIIRLTDSQQTISALPKILSYLKEKNCVVSTLSILDSPTNQRNDYR